MILALVGALVIGMSLGLLGSGGSILTVPVLVFILQRPEKLAIAESLAIVGSIALVGAIPYAFRTQIHWSSVLFFGLPGMLGACVGGWCSYYISSSVQLTLFALAMFTVAGAMFSGPFAFHRFNSSPQILIFTILQGFLVGFLTGFIGVGGGFLIVPALVILNHLSMSFAIGTSLIIIAMNSFMGFLLQFIALNILHLDVDWKVIGFFTFIGILGSLFGSLIAKSFSQSCLRKAFGISVLLIGFYTLIKQII